MNEPKVIIVVKVLNIVPPRKNDQGKYWMFTQKVGKFLEDITVGDLVSFEHPFVYYNDSMLYKGFPIKITNLSTMKSTTIAALYLYKLWNEVITEFEQIEL